MQWAEATGARAVQQSLREVRKILPREAGYEQSLRQKK